MRSTRNLYEMLWHASKNMKKITSVYIRTPLQRFIEDHKVEINKKRGTKNFLVAANEFYKELPDEDKNAYQIAYKEEGGGLK